MSLRKGIRADNTYMVPGNDADNPKLGAKKLSDGRESLFLDYYLGYETVVDERTGKRTTKKHRKRESLKLYLWTAPRTAQERQQNKETFELAKKIRFEKEQELKESTLGYRLRKDQDINFLDYFQSYIDNYTKKDIRMVQIALQRFKDFLRDIPKYNRFQKSIKPQQITKDMIIDFTDYLKSRSVGEGANSIYARFKKVVSYAEAHDVILENPCKGVIIKVDSQMLRKDVLSVDEIEQLVATHYEQENPNVQRAFIFCLYTGLRFCDVKDLTFRNVDYSNKQLSFEQSKTKGHSSNSGVVIPLKKKGLLQLIGEPGAGQDRDSKIFPLPSYESCCKSVKRWVKRAGIDKHISWHCARHSFAVNILNNGANIKTVATLLGHSGLKHTEKYTRSVDKLKEDAIDSLPDLEF